MGKNAHGPRNHGKKAAPHTTEVPESNVVFTNDTEDKKPKKPAKPQTAVADGSQADAPKKPATRELIGGSSWTGKLPVNLLSEHCQKMKWEKPEYTMVGAVTA